MRLKTMAQAFQFAAEFQVVIDLAIEDDGCFAVFGLNGLIAAHQVDDLQASRSQRADAGPVYALLVGATVNQRRSGCLNPAGVGRPALMRKTSNTTQNAKTLPVVLRSYGQSSGKCPARELAVIPTADY